MKKVFVTYIPDDLEDNTKYVSSDYFMPEKQFKFPVSNMMATHLEANDEVKIVCCFPLDSEEDEEVKEIYEALQAEICEITEKQNCSAEFVAVNLQCLDEEEEKPRFAADSVMRGFRNIVKEIQQGDTVFTDLSYGLKVYALSMFLAAYYSITTTKDVSNGSIFSAISVEQDVKDIVKADRILLATSLAGELGEGSRSMLDKLIGIGANAGMEKLQSKNEKESENIGVFEDISKDEVSPVDEDQD